MRTIIARSIVVFFAGLGLSDLRAEVQPLDSPPDALGQSLQQHMIWVSPEAKPGSAFIAFRKRFSLVGVPELAELSLFADVRYMLWINGKYVLRGPARFNPKGPEYDSAKVDGYLQTGENEVVVLVMANQSNGKMMSHVPGLTVRLDIARDQRIQTVLSTDATWKWSDRTRYRNPRIDWGNEMDVIDSTVEDGDWTQLNYDDRAWANAAKIDGSPWGALSARRIPLLQETPLDVKLNDQELPISLSAGQEARFKTDRLVQAYTAIDFEADAGSRFELPYAKISYQAKAGRQVYLSSDTHGFKDGSIKVTAGKITIHSFQPVERIYPFECVGSFTSNDPLLNKLWKICARSLQVMSEDAYVDCADRERTEWMDNTPPCYDITRTAMAGPGENDTKIYGDPRLLEVLLRRTALTLQPDGWVKAHTCSDRFDIHAKMEDRACDWVQCARLYYESTGNAAPIREIWPAIARQMDYFLERRTSRGLVRAREWVFSGNPIGYETGEGAGLNAFVYKALVDAAYLGNAIGEKPTAAKFDQAAKELFIAFNKVLWDEKAGTYYSGYCSEEDRNNPDDQAKKMGLRKKVDLKVENNLIEPTMYPALWALDQGLVPAVRHGRVTKYLLDNRQQAYPEQWLMSYYYLFGQMYAANNPALDTEILDIIRAKWKGMADSPWQTTWEHMIAGSKAHCYGMFPGYFLSAYVLGVRPDGPKSSNRLLIDPRLGDLTSAEGKVVTEFGLVPVSWKRDSDHLDFEFQVPEGVTASLRLPAFAGKAVLVLDNETVGPAVAGETKFKVPVKSGVHRGKLTFPAGSFNSVRSDNGRNFHDDFIKENSLWLPSSGTWKTEAGIYSQTDASVPAISGLKDLTWSDATYSFSLSLQGKGDGSNWAGFQFRKPEAGSSPDQGGYLVYLRENGSLEFFNGRVLQSVKTGLEPSKMIRFKVVAQGDHFQVYLNDEPQARIDVHDGSFTGGHIGFSCNHIQAGFGPLSVEVKP